MQHRNDTGTKAIILKEVTVDLRKHPYGNDETSQKYKDYLQYHLERIQNTSSTNLGDAHANLLKIIWFGLYNGYFTLSPEKYERMAGFYYQYENLLTRNRASLPAIEELNREILTIIDEIEFRTLAQTDSLALLRYIGDEFSDRGVCDFLNVYFFDQLMPHVNTEFLGSNHSLALLEYYFRQNEIQYPLTILEDFRDFNRYGVNSFIQILPCTSIQSLDVLIKNNFIWNGESARNIFNRFMRERYLPALKLISYDYNPHLEFLCISSHAPIDIPIILEVARFFGIADASDHSPEALMKTIDAINVRYHEELANNPLQLLKQLNSDSHILAKVVWNRVENTLYRPYRYISVEFLLELLNLANILQVPDHGKYLIPQKYIADKMRNTTIDGTLPDYEAKRRNLTGKFFDFNNLTEKQKQFWTRDNRLHYPSSFNIQHPEVMQELIDKINTAFNNICTDFFNSDEAAARTYNILKRIETEAPQIHASSTHGARSELILAEDIPQSFHSGSISGHNHLANRIGQPPCASIHHNHARTNTELGMPGVPQEKMVVPYFFSKPLHEPQAVHAETSSTAPRSSNQIQFFRPKPIRYKAPVETQPGENHNRAPFAVMEPSQSPI